MSTVAASSNTAAGSAPLDPPPPPYRPRQRPANPDGSSGAVASPSVPAEKGPSRKQRHRLPKVDGDRAQDKKFGGDRKSRAGGGGEKGAASNTAGGAPKQQRSDSKRPRPPREPRKQPADSTTADGATHPEANEKQSDKPPGGRKGKGRASKFNGGLTDPSRPSEGEVKEEQSNAGKYRRNLPQADDLTSRLIRDLSVPPYADCPICFSAIHPAQPTWSCSPLIPISAVGDDEDGKSSGRAAETAQCCWTTFHLKCIRPWAEKSVKDLEAAWHARGEERKGEWRCPGCQSKRSAIPASYWCYCGSTPDPKPPRLATPHSCASPCSRPRACGHACPLPCHPGPCPPCSVTIQVPCFCSKQVMSFRCSNLAPSRAGKPASPSCGKVCGKRLGCGIHTCEAVCHEGPCAPCSVRETARCYCGKEEHELGCGEGVERISVILLEDSSEERWIGRFECDNKCDRPFDCGIHHCERSCHVPSPTPAPCPRSPSVVETCPCGKHALEPASAPFFPVNIKLARTACTDPIPTCESTCMRPLEGCSHLCAFKCHTGPCPPCSITIVRPCRCGRTTRDVPCYEDQQRSRGELEEVLCDKPCAALRACGRHQCNRQCCPLSSLATTSKGKGKKVMDMGVIVDEAGWHECDLVCGKPLACGNHVCELRDHRGPCPSCLRSSFEEMICHCGRTVLEPPIPCGTRISCRYPCDRVRPCGHPNAQHACHEDSTPCPPCPFLATKQCACGKNIVNNMRCSQENVSCGIKCGKLLSCGFHQCERLCHGDNCGDCHAVCGKSRKLCLPANHPCTLPCHAPASCSEADPCLAPITITCSCGRIRQSVPCGRSTANPAGLEGSQQLKCTNECAIAKRNARLAEALRVNPTGRSFQVTYSDDLQRFARADMKFCLLVEKTFADFAASDKRSQILPHTPESRRKFVHDLAAVYRMDTQMVDQEPHRSVQLFKRLDTRVPAPLLSATVAQSAAAGPSLGKLADLRAPVAQLLRPPAGPGRSLASTSTPPPHAPASTRGWTSVVARPTSAQQAAPDPNAWLLGAGGRSGSPAASSTAAPPARPRATPSPAPVHVPPTIQTNPEDIPDDWEDEA